eukprot:Skav200137  [mRNA]  locus=scaffold4172:264542:268527:+ [translate_table: standard]
MSSFCSKTLEDEFTVSIKACLVLSVAPVMVRSKLSTPTFCESTFCSTESCDESNLCSSTWHAFTVCRMATCEKSIRCAMASCDVSI